MCGFSEVCQGSIKYVAREGDLAFSLRILSSHFSLSNGYRNNVTKGMYCKYSNIALSTLMGEVEFSMGEKQGSQKRAVSHR